MFAKLFGPPDDQILAIIREGESNNDEDVTEVRFFFKIRPESQSIFDLCETALCYVNEDKARQFFEKLTEAEAREVVEPIRKSTSRLL